MATPLFVVLVLIETTDLVFAVDSIPAVFGITQDPLIVYTSNVFAILCLRSMYFILAGITTRELLNATDMAIEMKQKGVLGKPCPDYVDETVSMKVVRIIQGYVNVVNKMVWRKY